MSVDRATAGSVAVLHYAGSSPRFRERRLFRFRPLPERRLVERAQFAAVQLRSLVAQAFTGLDPDLKMGGDRFFVEAVRLSGQLEFAVERLVADAE